MENKFIYFNNTDKLVSIHPATLKHGCEVDLEAIKPGEHRLFLLPEGAYPWLRMFEYSTHFEILVSPHNITDDNYVGHEPTSPIAKAEAHRIIEHLRKRNPHDKEDK